MNSYHIVLEEKRLKNEPVKNINVATTSKNKGKKKHKAADKDKDKGHKKQKDTKGKQSVTTSESDIYFFARLKDTIRSSVSIIKLG
jgi:hypothetical protein